MLQEGVYDPGIFKAFFLAGGPGSGKTFITQSAFAGTGLKVVNSDTIFERSLLKANLSLKMPDHEEYFRDIVRRRSKLTAGSQLEQYVQGRLGLIIDATGRDKTVITRQHSMLKAIGYDTYMIFVNTSLDVQNEHLMENQSKQSAEHTMAMIVCFSIVFQPAKDVEVMHVLFELLPKESQKKSAQMSPK